VLSGQAAAAEAPKPEGKLRRTIQEVDDALELHKGDRTLAANHLGMTPRQVKERIQYHGSLNLKWGRAGILARAKDALAGAEGGPLANAERQVAEASRCLSLSSNRVLDQIRKVEERIQLGEDARFSDNPEVQKYAFKLDNYGAPVEEKMLREHLLDLLDEYRKRVMTFQQGAWITTKIAMLKHKAGPETSQVKRAKAGFTPKGAMLNFPGKA
jgi:hypothetical protein